MFGYRKYPEPKPVPCPFKAAPFTFTYNRGSGECSNPPSRAESCTDDSRLVLKYQACPDIQSTESNIEELVCVATWKEGNCFCGAAGQLYIIFVFVKGPRDI